MHQLRVTDSPEDDGENQCGYSKPDLWPNHVVRKFQIRQIAALPDRVAKGAGQQRHQTDRGKGERRTKRGPVVLVDRLLIAGKIFDRHWLVKK